MSCFYTYQAINNLNIESPLMANKSNCNGKINVYLKYWNAKNDIGKGVAAGTYIYTIRAGEFRATKKMVLLK